MHVRSASAAVASEEEQETQKYELHKPAPWSYMAVKETGSEACHFVEAVV